jgi:drug/metabolite transporter (DMT)-like permease
MNHQSIGILFVLIAAICFSMKAIIIKLAYAHYPIDALTLLTMRMAFSLPVFLIVFIQQSRQATAQPITLWQHAQLIAIGLLGYYASAFLDFEGLRYITAGLERLILFAYPTLVVLLSWLFFQKSITNRVIIALILTYIGIALALSKGVGGEQKNLWLGVGFVFASAFTYAWYLIGSGELIPKLGSLRFTGYAMIVSSISVFLHYLCFGKENIFTLPTSVYGYGWALALISTILPVFMLSEGIKRVGSSKAAIAGSIGPVATIVLAYFFLGETISLFEAMGTGFVLGGVWMIGKK